MNPARFRKIREKLELTQEDLAYVLCLAGKTVISRIEAGDRNPSKLAIAVMEILNDLPSRKAMELMELLRDQSGNNRKSMNAKRA